MEEIADAVADWHDRSEAARATGKVTVETNTGEIVGAELTRRPSFDHVDIQDEAESTTTRAAEGYCVPSPGPLPFGSI